MIIYIAADHRGFKLKEYLKKFLKKKNYWVVDTGNIQYDPDDDYPDFASAAAKKVSEDPYNSRGILICGSGVGMDVTANKYKNVRSALVANPAQAKASRQDDNTNILTLASDFLTLTAAKKIFSAWIAAPFSKAPRHQRRLKKIAKLERALAK